jgi:hypothetical protein
MRSPIESCHDALLTCGGALCVCVVVCACRQGVVEQAGGADPTAQEPQGTTRGTGSGHQGTTGTLTQHSTSPWPDTSYSTSSIERPVRILEEMRRGVGGGHADIGMGVLGRKGGREWSWVWACEADSCLVLCVWCVLVSGGGSTGGECWRQRQEEGQEEGQEIDTHTTHQ